MSAMYFTGAPFVGFHHHDERANVESTLRVAQHPLEQDPCAGLVERLVQVSALRALHTRRAAARTGAAGEQPRRVLDPALEAVVAAGGDADAARVAVVDE